MDDDIELLNENLLESLRDVDNSIITITESIQVLRAAKLTLDSKADKTPEDEVELERLQTTLYGELNVLEGLYDRVNRLLVELHSQTYQRIDPSQTAVPQSTTDLLLPFCKSSEFRQVVVVNRGSTNEPHPTIMVLQSMTDFDNISDCQSCCVSRSENPSDSSDSISCAEPVVVDQTCINDATPVTVSAVNSDASRDIYYARLNRDLLKLKEQTQNVFNKNQRLRFELEATIEWNDLLTIVLQCPAPFKTLASGEIVFPGKHEMDKKLLLLKEEIIDLNHGLDEIYANQLKLKSAKEIMIIDRYNKSPGQCQYKFPKRNYGPNNVEVKRQQIKYVESQLTETKRELERIINDYGCTVETNSKVIAANQQLTEHLADLTKQAETYNLANVNDAKNELRKINEEIETMELVIKENENEINFYATTLQAVLAEVEKKSNEVKKLQDSLNVLKNEYDVTYQKLKSNYQEQLEEMVALPVLLKASLIKLQEETDKLMLAKETNESLERRISEEQKKQKPVQTVDETKNQLEIENETIESKLKCLEKHIQSETECLRDREKELEDISAQVKEAAVESAKHVNAFNRFSTIRMEAICNELRELQEALTKLQAEECAKTVVKKSAKEYLTNKIESIQRNLEECKLEAITFLCRTNKSPC